MVGERLHDLRKDANMTQEELAVILNVTKASISSYENDKSEPPDSVKIKIAQLFDVSIDYLLGLSNKPYIEKEKVNYIRVTPDISKEMASFIQALVEFIVEKHLME